MQKYCLKKQENTEQDEPGSYIFIYFINENDTLYCVFTTTFTQPAAYYFIVIFIISKFSLVSAVASYWYESKVNTRA